MTDAQEADVDALLARALAAATDSDVRYHLREAIQLRNAATRGDE